MTGRLELNLVIAEAITKSCPDERYGNIIRQLLEYELRWDERLLSSAEFKKDFLRLLDTHFPFTEEEK